MALQVESEVGIAPGSKPESMGAQRDWIGGYFIGESRTGPWCMLNILPCCSRAYVFSSIPTSSRNSLKLAIQKNNNVPPLRSETPSVPRQMRGILTLSTSISVDTSVSAIVVGISIYLESLLRNNYVRIVAVTPNPQRAFF